MELQLVLQGLQTGRYTEEMSQPKAQNNFKELTYLSSGLKV